MSKIKQYRNIEGFLSAKEAIKLYHFASTLPKGSIIVEIGSWKGKSTYCLARGLRDGKVIAIDPFDASGDEESRDIYLRQRGNDPLIYQFKRQMEIRGVADKIKILQGTSDKFVGQIPKIDFLFIDGDHSKEACEFDFVNYSPAISLYGYLAFHDYKDSREHLGPTWVVKNRVVPCNEFQFVGLFDSLWVAKKILR
jgi:hypothetical protein